VVVRRSLSIAAGFLLAVGLLPASTLEKLSLDDMIVKSTLIVRATAGSSSAAFHGPIIFTHYRIQVMEVLKGSASATLDVMVPGGILNGQQQVFAGAPTLATDGEYVLFLWTGRTGTQIIGLTQGLFQLPKNATSKSYATRNATNELVLEPVTGRPVQDETLQIRLGDLKTRIAAVLGKGTVQ